MDLVHRRTSEGLWNSENDRNFQNVEILRKGN